MHFHSKCKRLASLAIHIFLIVSAVFSTCCRREVDDEFCNDSYDVSIGPAVVLEEHLRQSNSDTKRYIYQLNNTYYEAEVGFAAPDYWIAERTKHFAETGQYPEHTFEAAYVKSCTKAIKEGFETGQQPSTEILKHVP